MLFNETYSFKTLEVVINKALLLEVLRAYDADKSKKHVDL